MNVPNNTFGILTVEDPPSLWIVGAWAANDVEGTCIMNGRSGVGAVEPHGDHVHILFGSVNDLQIDGVPLDVSLAYGDMLMGFMDLFETSGRALLYDGTCNTQLTRGVNPLDYISYVNRRDD
jgi:hypothetical protein